MTEQESRGIYLYHVIKLNTNRSAGIYDNLVKSRVASRNSSLGNNRTPYGRYRSLLVLHDESREQTTEILNVKRSCIEECSDLADLDHVTEHNESLLFLNLDLLRSAKII